MPTRLDWGQIGPPPSLSGLRYSPSDYTVYTVGREEETSEPPEEEFYDIWQDVEKVV